MNPRQAWRDWHRIGRVLRREIGVDEPGWLNIHASYLRLRPAIRTGRPSLPCAGQLSINGSTRRIRWLYRCHRYGQMAIREARSKLAAGLTG